jgi:hypothetical protein
MRVFFNIFIVVRKKLLFWFRLRLVLFLLSGE